MDSFIGGAFLGIAVCTALNILFLGPYFQENGAIKHASGQITCALTEQPDKTTEWVCSEVQK